MRTHAHVHITRRHWPVKLRLRSYMYVCSRWTHVRRMCVSDKSLRGFSMHAYTYTQITRTTMHALTLTNRQTQTNTPCSRNKMHELSKLIYKYKIFIEKRRTCVSQNSCVSMRTWSVRRHFILTHLIEQIRYTQHSLCVRCVPRLIHIHLYGGAWNDYY